MSHYLPQGCPDPDTGRFGYQNDFLCDECGDVEVDNKYDLCPDCEHAKERGGLE